MKPPRLTGLLAGFLACSLTVFAGTPVGQFADSADIGAPAIPGSTTYDASIQTYRMSGAGSNIWGTADQFQYASNKMKGDFIVRARVAFVGLGTDPHRKLGWMARASADKDAPYVDACVHGDGLTSLQFRRTKGGITEQVVLELKGGDVIQLERKGNTYIFSSARYGETFTTGTLADLDLGEELDVGLFLCAHNAAVKEEALVRDVRIVQPPKAGYVPYRDYIGAHLEILNVHTGQLQIVASSPEQFEAPNWMLDGKTLIVNVSGPGPNKGQLKTFNLLTKEWGALDTGNIGRNNNDHVLTFDGKQLGISVHTPEDGGRSGVWKLPSAGGKPTKVTKNSPSYFHGWSVDGKWMVFTGGRKETPDAKADKYDIYKIPADGGDEVRLTSSPGLSDGPEFSPDGKYIYFTSTRTGLMQIYRMNLDGSNQEQITNDGLNNWFPHISPDGKWIAFISFNTDVKPDQHPYYQQCYIRLMPIGGGTPRVVAYVFGGQGTINVPSWSQDSARVAFVSNSDNIK
jgi:TolB protein